MRRVEMRGRGPLLERRRTVAMSAVLGCALLLAACGGDDQDSAEQVAPTGGGDAEPVTLTMWAEATSTTGAALEVLIPEFEQEHPNVTVDLQVRNFEELSVQGPLALSGDESPDIIQGWAAGHGVLGRFVKAGDIIPLDEYADQYGWWDRVGGLLTQLQFSADGAEWGTGNLWAAFQTSGMLGVYYNKEKLAGLGLDLPTTFEEFLGTVDAAMQAGETAIMVGNSAAFHLAHVHELIQDAVIDKDHHRSWVYGHGGGALEYSTPETIKAAEIIRDLGTGGAFNDDYNGTAILDALERFGNGEGVFFFTGTWFAPNLDDAMGDNVGFFAMPGTGGRAPLTTGSGDFYSIATRSEHPDLAAEFLDFISNERGAEVLVELGGLPAAGVDPSVAEPGSVIEDMYRVYGDLAGADRINPYINFATPGIYNTWSASLQELAAGRLEPPDFVDGLQDEYETFWSSQ